MKLETVEVLKVDLVEVENQIKAILDSKHKNAGYHSQLEDLIGSASRLRNYITILESRVEDRP